MKQHVTSGVVLQRINYGEADRIVTVLTTDSGKIRLMAKGARRVRSKLAGGIELFSTSTYTFVESRGEIKTLISARLDQHFPHIIEYVERTMAGYDALKQLNRVTEDQSELAWYHVAEGELKGLNDSDLPLHYLQTWFFSQLLTISGHQPNVEKTIDNQPLTAGGMYQFDLENMGFSDSPRGTFSGNHIKLLRLLFTSPNPTLLKRVQGGVVLAKELLPILQQMVKENLGLHV